MSSFPVISTSCLLQHPLTIGSCPFINTGARVHKSIISSAVIRIFVIVTKNSQPQLISILRQCPHALILIIVTIVSEWKYYHDSSKHKSCWSPINIGDKARGARDERPNSNLE